MKRFKRALAMLLALSMVVGLCPAMAVEAEEEGILFLSGADVSTTEEPEGGAGEDILPDAAVQGLVKRNTGGLL